MICRVSTPCAGTKKIIGRLYIFVFHDEISIDSCGVCDLCHDSSRDHHSLFAVRVRIRLDCVICGAFAGATVILTASDVCVCAFSPCPDLSTANATSVSASLLSHHLPAAIQPRALPPLRPPKPPSAPY